MLQWSPDLEDSKIVPRRRPISFVSVRVEIEQESEPSVHFSPADMRASALRVRSGDGAAGPRDREPSPNANECAGAMYACIAQFI